MPRKKTRDKIANYLNVPESELFPPQPKHMGVQRKRRKRAIKPVIPAPDGYIKIQGVDLKALEEGISLQNKRKWDKNEPPVDEELPPEPEQPKPDVMQLLRQKELGEKLDTAKAVNYSGFAVNGGSIFMVLYGFHELALDPNTAETVALFNETFGTEFDYQAFIDTIEIWKAHLVSLAGSLQVGFVWYQSMRQKMKNLDTPKSFIKFINDEIGEVI